MYELDTHSIVALGETVDADASKPFLIDDPEWAWVVEAGKLDLFFSQTENGTVAGPRVHVLRAVPGEVLIGMEPDAVGTTSNFLAVGTPGTRLRKIRQAVLREPDAFGTPKPIAISLLERWLSMLSQAVAPDKAPKDCQLLDPGTQMTVDSGAILTTANEIIWVKHVSGMSQFLGQPGVLPVRSGAYFPLTRQTWLVPSNTTVLECLDTTEFVRLNPEWKGLQIFHHVILSSLVMKMLQSEEQEQARIAAKGEADERLMRSSLMRLASPLRSDSEHAPVAVHKRADPLLLACQTVGAALDVPVKSLLSPEQRTSHRDPLREIAKASNIRIRRVLLRGQWWREDHGPLLVFSQEEKRPLALVAAPGKKYELHDPVAHTRIHVNEKVAASLDPVAYVFYRPLPHKKLDVRDLFAFGLKGASGEVTTMLLTGIASGLLALVTPIFIGIIFNTVIPSAQRSQLTQLTLLLLAAAITSGIFRMTQNLAVLRLEGRMGASLQAAVWDRLLDLPAPFFRRYSAGDLADRANGIDAIRQVLTGTVSNSIITGMFSLFSFALLFYYSVKLALVATGIALVSFAVTIIFGYMQVRHMRQLIQIGGTLSGSVLQYINGIAKFRVCGAESRAFAAWANGFAKQKTFSRDARRVSNYFTVFTSMLLILTPMTIFFAVFEWAPDLSAGDFLAFNTAFLQFFTAAMALSNAFISLMSIVPLYERAMPILHNLPEVSTSKVDPGELNGDIELSHVAFHYREDTPLVLRDLSFRVERGQFVALVGPSGCGKSTIFRMLLGFEEPAAGSIYYDGQDIKGLDLHAVRQQIGVVLQNGTLFSGDIFSNIVGSKPLTIDDAWEAARLAGLDEDIRRMPMGMHTVVAEGGAGLSGGQIQRLIIARSIVSRPRILLFDEATSALDNRTQAIVSSSLEKLKSTRIVIAHRISTIVNADKIFVIDGGVIAESGAYEELMAKDGMFKELAKRQVL